MVYRSINQEAPECLTGMFQRLSETCARQLRNTSTGLYVPFLKTACGQKCFSYRGAKLWNDLEREGMMANTFAQFKSSLKNDQSRALSHLSFTLRILDSFYLYCNFVAFLLEQGSL